MTTEQLKRSILDGATTFTLKNGKPAPDTREFTYRVVDGFVSLQSTADSYHLIGVLDATTGRVRLTPESAFKADSKAVQALGWALGLIWAGKPFSGAATLTVLGTRKPKTVEQAWKEDTRESNGLTVTARDVMEPRKRRSRKAPKPTFEQLRAQTQAAALENDGGLGLPSSPAPAVELITYDDVDEAEQAALAHDAAVIAAEAVVDTLDLGGFYSDNLAGFYAAAAAEDSVDRAERALEVQ